jgi:sugar/nucleoside kinase (ribokinase family)
MEGTKVLTVGDASVDRFFEVAQQEASLLADINTKDLFISFSYGEKVPVKDVHKSFGGSALNTAVAFAKLGLQTSIASIFGDDSDGKETIDFLNESSVQTSCCRQNGNSNQAAVIIYKHERTILSYHSKRIYQQLELPECNFVYFASATSGADDLIPKVKNLITSGVKLAFNPGSWELKNFDQFKDLVALSEFLILNKSEADLIVGEDKVKNQLKEMLKMGTKVAIITDGANGAYLAEEDKAIHMNTCATEIIDPTGAGDSFSAGVVGAYLLGKPLEEALKWGMVNCASVISKIGANSGLLTASQMELAANDASSLKVSII